MRRLGLSYRAIHTRLNQRHPKTGTCERCGAEGKTEYSYNRHPAPHTGRRADYEELCSLCHRKKDARLYRRTEPVPTLAHEQLLARFGARSSA